MDRPNEVNRGNPDSSAKTSGSGQMSAMLTATSASPSTDRMAARIRSSRSCDTRTRRGAATSPSRTSSMPSGSGAHSWTASSAHRRLSRHRLVNSLGIDSKLATKSSSGLRRGITRHTLRCSKYARDYVCRLAGPFRASSSSTSPGTVFNDGRKRDYGHNGSPRKAQVSPACDRLGRAGRRRYRALRRGPNDQAGRQDDGVGAWALVFQPLQYQGRRAPREVLDVAGDGGDAR